MIDIPLYNFASRLCVAYTAKPSVAATTTIATATTPTSTTAPTSTNPTGAPCDGIDPEKQPCCKLSDKTEQAKCLGEMTSIPTGCQLVVSHVSIMLMSQAYS